MADLTDRRYFTLLSEAGQAFPAVEYWAACLDESSPEQSVARVRRFIKLIGPDEPLLETGPGRFKGTDTGLTFTQLPRHSHVLQASRA